MKKQKNQTRCAGTCQTSGKFNWELKSNKKKHKINLKNQNKNKRQSKKIDKDKQAKQCIGMIFISCIKETLGNSIHILQFIIIFVTIFYQMIESVVIDSGTGLCKAGLSNQDAPRTNFSSVVGKPKLPSIMVGMDQRQSYVGQQATEKNNVLYLKNPIKHGLIQNWQDFAQIIHHTYYNELRVTPQQHPCLLTQTPKNPKENRQKLTQIIFQTFNVPQFYLSNQAILALFATGRTTGLVVDSGAGVTSSVPVYEGYSAPHAIQKINFGGNEINELILNIIKKKNQKSKLSLQADQAELQKIKLKLRINQRFQQYPVSAINSGNMENQQYVLPDGQTINIEQIQSKCGEMFYNFKKYDIDNMATIQQLTSASINKSDADVKKDLYNNIVLSGGSTNFVNFGQRLKNQMSAIYPSQSVHVQNRTHKEYLTWLGGSILSSLPSFQNMWVTRAEYQETGSAIIDKKCF